jgi:hypothetical protein
MRGLALLISVCVGACGDPPCPSLPLGDDLMPLAIGYSWTYEESGGPIPGTITKTVVGSEDFSGQETLVWETVQTNSPVTKRANWRDDGLRVTRLRQERYGPGDLFLDAREYEPGFLRIERTLDQVGAELTERHTRLEYDAAGNLVRSVSKLYNWRVEAVDETVRVPAGEFLTVRVRRTDVDQGSNKTYWYARGVGKVKEVGPLETEALAEFDVSSN